MQYTRKKAAELLGIGTETLRYYEKLGLIAEPERNSSGYRVYSETDTGKIDHILRIKDLGFTLKEIKEFLGMDNPDSKFIVDSVYKKIKDIEASIELLESRKKKLENFLDEYR